MLLIARRRLRIQIVRQAVAEMDELPRDVSKRYMDNSTETDIRDELNLTRGRLTEVKDDIRKALIACGICGKPKKDD